MRRSILWGAGLALLLALSAGHAEWRMVVHEAVGPTEFPVDSIQSVTFYNCPPTVRLPPGTFIMGDGAATCGHDEREVTLTRGFLLAQHETTNQEYLDALQWAYDNGYVTATTSSVRDALDGRNEELLNLADDGCEIQFDGVASFYLRESPSSYAQQAYPEGYDPSTHPVKEVSWFGAARYCDWLSLQAGLARAYQHSGDWACNYGDPYGAPGYRLPTDAEWEYAAQYDDERIYPWGNGSPDCSRTNFWPGSSDCDGGGSSGCIGWTTPVGSYPDAASALGLLDMSGNVIEWCNDWWLCDLGTVPVTDPLGPATGSERLLRGGSWNCWEENLPCAYRSSNSDADGGIGFRVARTTAR